jgi:hypothetical protein
MGQFFQFEADFVESLRCIPMQVRFKLDTCGVKLKLTHWNQFSLEERQLLMDWPCDRAEDIDQYRERLQSLIIEKTGESAGELAIAPNPPWFNATAIPDSVTAKALELGIPFSREQWATLTPLQRFALIKLSRSGHENSNFLPALKEFHLGI